MQSRLHSLRNVLCLNRSSQWSTQGYRSFATRSAYKDEGTQKIIQDIRKLEHKLEMTNKMEEATYGKLEEHDIEAIYKDLATKTAIAQQQQPKISTDYLERLRVKFLDTRTLQQLTSSSLKALSQNAPNDANTLSDSGLFTSSPDSISLTTENDESSIITAFDYEKLIYANALAKRPQQAEQALKLMKDNGTEPTVRCYNHLMDAYANVNNVEQVVDVFKRLGDAGLSPDVYSYASLVKVLVQNSRLSDAFVVLDQMKKTDVLPTQPIFSKLISGCLKSRRMDKAWQTFDEMRLSYCQPDEVTFTMMINGCAMNGEVERALNLFEEMTGLQLYPTDVTFNTLIHACAKRSDYYDEAFSLLYQMEDMYGFQPDLITYNTLLGACARKRTLEKARDIFRYLLQSDQLKPDIQSFTNMFWCYANYDPPTCNHNDMSKSSPIHPSDSSLVATALDLLIPKDLPTRRSAVVDEAASVFNYMIQQQEIKMTTSLLTAYLNTHVTQQQTKSSADIYNTLFSTYNVSPNPYTFKVMLRYCYQSKDTDMAWKVWDDYQAFLETRALPPTYSDMTMMEQKKIKVERNRSQVMEGWSVPQQRSLVILMASVLARANELHYAVQLLNTSFIKDGEMKPLRLNDVMTVYNKAIQLEDESMVQEIKRLCSHGPKKPVSGSTKYRRINSVL